MSPSTTIFTLWRRFLEILVAVMACLADPAYGQTPQLGEIQVLPVINISLKVGGVGRESKRTTYSPPPGWYIRSHQVMCIERYGTTSYAVNTVPAGWVWNSEEQSNAMHQRLTDLAAKAEDVAAQFKLNVKHDDAAYDLLRASAGKHALVLETSATGAGLLRGGSGIQLRVFAEMVYIGIDRTPFPYPSLGGPVVNGQTVRQVNGSK